MNDTSIKLPDGRLLAYTDLGSPDGPVVVYCHGAPTSRLDLTSFEDAFVESDVRVVSVDRPGYGASSPRPERTFDDWSADLAVLLDVIGVEHCAVMGWSSGGPYVVATAALLSERVVAAGIVAGVSDMGWAGAWDGYDEDEVALMKMGDEDTAVAWCEDRYGSDGVRFAEGVGDLAPADLELMNDEAVGAAIMATITEAFHQGVRGYVQDILLQARPWPFDPAAITAPVIILHGGADTLVPSAHARHTAELVPGAELRILPEHGHLSLLTQFAPLAAELVTPLR
jgi:pimeloyl-ACP methyl ester carboxylesterase